MAGDQGALELRDHGVAEAVQAGPGVDPVTQEGEQVVAELDAERLELVAGGAELAEGGDGGRLGGRPGVRHGHLLNARPVGKNRSGAMDLVLGTYGPADVGTRDDDGGNDDGVGGSWKS